MVIRFNTGSMYDSKIRRGINATTVASVASKMAHAKPIQTIIVFAWVFGQTLNKSVNSLYDYNYREL